MVIGLFVDAFPPLMDGVASVVLNYKKNLEAMGNEVYVIAGDYGDAKKTHYDEKNHLTNVYRLKVIKFAFSRPYGILRITKKDYDNINKIKFDIIHIHSPFYTGKMGLKIAKMQNVPTVGTIHSQFYYDIMSATHNSKFITNAFLKSIRKVFSQCDSLWAVSSTSKKVFERPPYNFGSNIEVCNNACDFKVDSEDQKVSIIQKAKAIVGEDNKDPILLYVGQQHNKKNLPHVLEALKILHDNGTKFKAVFVGQGPHLTKYKNFVKKNNMTDSFIFTGLLVDRSIVAGMYAISYMLLFPSYYDTACIVKREAAYFNVPTLFGEGSVTSEGVENKVNGYTAKDNPEDIADTIKWALTHQDEHKAIGEKARVTIYSTWQDRVKEVQERYLEIIKNYKSRNQQ